MTDAEKSILIGKAGTEDVRLLLERANRHGFVAGATGTGKTVTLQVLAQAFSDAGVPVFAADVKGDLAGIAAAAVPNDRLLDRASALGLTLQPQAAPTIFWDLFGRAGHPIRTTVSEMGPILLSRLLELSEAQDGVLTIAFHVADENGWLLLDLDDLSAVLTWVGQNREDIGLRYGAVAPQTVGALQRKILALRSQGAQDFFGEPALKLEDLMQVSPEGKGYVSVLAADQLIQTPRAYSTFLLWLLSELFEELPEAGDLPKPKLVFFFDEAHLLFRDAPRPLMEKVEQVVRLVRSKGVGVYFVTQNPADIPEPVMAQLGMRAQHALRAYTPQEQKGLRAAAQSFRANPAFETAEAIQQLGVGEALVSALDASGAPTVVARTSVRPPSSRIGPLTPDERNAVMARSPVRGRYDTAVNRESAYEVLNRRAAEAAATAASPPADPFGAPARPPAGQAPRAAPQTRGSSGFPQAFPHAPSAGGSPWGEAAGRAPQPRPRAEPRPAPAPKPRAAPRGRSRESVAEAATKSFARSAASAISREIMRGLFGTMRRRR